MRRIYLASSWRNAAQPTFVQFLRHNGHQVYDFRNPGYEQHGFSWSEIDPEWKTWSGEEYIRALRTPTACRGYTNDLRAMEWADTCVMLLPCGNSAHIELGYMAGRGKRTIICLDDSYQPDLMYLVANHIVDSTQALLDALK